MNVLHKTFPKVNGITFKGNHTLMPSSSLTLRIIFTHISVILLKVGCSRQMSLRILITRFLTLIPVSCEPKAIKIYTVYETRH